jgi:ethanolamine utilization microcompartment shell protein EutS
MMGPIETGTSGRASIVEFYVALFCAALALGVLPAISGNIVLIYSVSN